jgi:heat shock protein HslJ
MKTLGTLFLAAALLVAGCKNTRSAAGRTTAPLPLEGTRWTLVRLGETPVTPRGTERDAHLIFSPPDAKGRVVGSTGCNRLMGGFTQSGTDTLRFQPAAVTKMACMEGVETETAFLQALQQVDGYQLRDNQLVLTRGGTPVATLERRPMN